jgi:hypothetical protein
MNRSLSAAFAAGLCVSLAAPALGDVWSSGDLGPKIIQDAGKFSVAPELVDPSNSAPAELMVKYGLWNSPDVKVDVYFNGKLLGSFVADQGYNSPGPEFAFFDVTGLLKDGTNEVVVTGNSANLGDYAIGQIDVTYEGGCYPDVDGDGELSIDDFIAFQTLFALGDAGADCDGNGVLDIDDFICFQTLFALGCE